MPKKRRDTKIVVKNDTPTRTLYHRKYYRKYRATTKEIRK